MDSRFLWIVGGIVALLLVVTGLNTCAVVSPTERGIVVTMGKVGDRVLPSGLHFKAPFFQGIKKYSISPKPVEFGFSVGQNGAVSKDMQTIGTQCTVFWKYDESRLLEAVKNYTDLSLTESIRAATLSSTKEVIGTFTIYELVEKQNEVQNKVTSSVNEKIAMYPIILTQVTIGNWDWPDSFDQQIAETMKRAQQVKQAQQELLITEQNAQKQIKEAEARKKAVEIEAESNLVKTQKEAEANLIRAQKMAEATKVEADAIAYKNAKIAQNLSVEIKMKELENEAARIAKWNGQYVPTNNYGPIPLQSGAIQGR